MGRFPRFAIVGAVGFVIDAGLLAILDYGVGLDILKARLLSIAAAMLITWRLNRGLTFAASQHSQASEGLRYAAVASLGAALNYAVYAVALLIEPGLPSVAAATLATLVAMAFSYAGYSRFVFSAGGPAVRVSPRLQRR